MTDTTQPNVAAQFLPLKPPADMHFSPVIKPLVDNHRNEMIKAMRAFAMGRWGKLPLTDHTTNNRNVISGGPLVGRYSAGGVDFGILATARNEAGDREVLVMLWDEVLVCKAISMLDSDEGNEGDDETS